LREGGKKSESFFLFLPRCCGTFCDQFVAINYCGSWTIHFLLETVKQEKKERKKIERKREI
jgi:hypothetical protein